MNAVEEVVQAIGERYERLPIELLIESPFNPRKTFDAAKLKELTASIIEKGVVEPIVVRPWSKHTDKFEIVCGARRYRASKAAGLRHVPAVIRALTDTQIIELMAIENSQRDDVPPLEEAAGYKQLLLIDQAYTPAAIATKIGRTEKFVFDRLRLLELIPEAKALLTEGVIGVEHAEVLARLKPAEQKQAISREHGGLFEPDFALAFDADQRPGTTAYSKVKPRSVRQLKEWIARHVRFDVQHAAKTAPLEFAAAAEQVAAAEAAPGRGKKVVPITFEHTCPYGAADGNERTYGATAWKKAVGKDGQPTCEHAVLGVVVAGAHYGDTFPVCIAREACLVHWKDSVQAKQKAATLRESGKGKQAAKVEKKTEAKQQDRWKVEQAEREKREKAWGAISTPVLAAALEQVRHAKALTPAQAKALEQIGGEFGFRDAKKHLGATWFTQLAAAWLVSAVTGFHFHSYSDKGSGFDQFVKEVAKPLGLNIKRLEVIRDAHQPKAAAAAPAKPKKGRAA